MDKKHTLGILALVAIFAAVLSWMLGGSDTAPPVTQPGSADSQPSRVAAHEAGADSWHATEADGANNARIAVEAGAGRLSGPGIALIGCVVDGAGMPVPEALVACTPSPDLSLLDPDELEQRVRSVRRQRTEGTTDSEGCFRIAPRGKSRRVQVRVLARGYAVLNKNATRPVEADVDLGTLTVKRGAIVSGRVVDHSGIGVTGARVDRNEGGPGGLDFEFLGSQVLQDLRAGDEAVTDSDGRFELAHVAPGEFTLRARHPDHPIAWLKGQHVAPGMALTDLVIVAEPGATIRGRLLGVPAGLKSLRVLAATKRDESAQRDGHPFYISIADSMLPFGERSTDVAADGSFALRGLAADRVYRVWATQSRRGLVGGSPCSERVDAPAGSQGIELRYEDGVTLSFRVVDDRTGRPIEQLSVREQLRGGGGFAEIMWFDSSGRASKDYPDGRVTIPNLRLKPKQTLSLTVDAIGYLKYERDKIVLPTVGAFDLGTVRLQRGPVIAIEATAAADGSPIEGARVSLREYRDGGQGPGLGGGALSGRTDTDGRCKINGVPNTRVIVSVKNEDYAPFSSPPLELAAQGEVRVQARLLQGGAVEVTVLDEDGAPAGKELVTRRGPDGASEARTTDAAGKLVIDRLVPGQHRFRVGGNHRHSVLTAEGDVGVYSVAAPSGKEPLPTAGWESVDVTDGGHAALTLSKRPSAALTGVVRENRLPLAGARITLLEGSGSEPGPGHVQHRIVEVGGDGSRCKSDDRGNYEFEGLPAGEHRLRITHDDRAMATTVPISLRVGGNEFDIDLETTILRGTVRGPNGTPVAGATVRATPADKGTGNDSSPFAVLLDYPWFGAVGLGKITGADGRFELRGVQGGIPLVVRARADGFAPAVSATVEVAAGSSRDDIDVQLSAAGRIHVVIAQEVSFGVVTATFQGDNSAGAAPVYQQLRSGSATLMGLRPGRWKVVVNPFGEQRYDPLVVEVIAGRTTEVAF